ncbi:MAG TPA: hypothetical protein VMD91_00045 [Candidatus Sulfotelmatobacter sp.]|nr:hypothetical protein [Candidatus Sulfotelmatobacter sp.]
MSSERTPSPTNDPKREAIDDERDAVLAADDTGLVAGEQLITVVESVERDADDAGNT